MLGHLVTKVIRFYILEIIWRVHWYSKVEDFVNSNSSKRIDKSLPFELLIKIINSLFKEVYYLRWIELYIASDWKPYYLSNNNEFRMHLPYYLIESILLWKLNTILFTLILFLSHKTEFQAFYQRGIKWEIR